jgi:hypothetical protein
MRKLLLVTTVAIVALCGVAAFVPGKPLAYRSEVLVELPLSRSWALLSDLTLAHEYVPGIQRTELVGDKATGVGASRRVFSGERDYIRETVTRWQEGEGCTLDLHDDEGNAPAPFSQASFDYRLEAAGEDRTLVSTELRFILRGGVVGQWLGSALLGGVFQEQVDAVTESLKVFYEGT